MIIVGTLRGADLRNAKAKYWTAGGSNCHQSKPGFHDVVSCSVPLVSEHGTGTDLTYCAESEVGADIARLPLPTTSTKRQLFHWKNDLITVGLSPRSGP